MKFLDKKNLFIQENNEKGTYDFVYNPDIIMSSDKYDDIDLVNIVTKERIPYKEILLTTSNNGKAFYFYPPELYGTSKVINDYSISQWLFAYDSRLNNVNIEDFRAGMTDFTGKITEAITRMGEIANEFSNLARNTSDSLRIIQETFNRGNSGYNIKPQQNTTNYTTHNGIIIQK